MRPESTYPTCATWQLSVPAIGLTWSDQRQPGSNVPRPIELPPTLTSSTRPMSSLNGRTSSGAPNCLDSRLMAFSFGCDGRTGEATLLRSEYIVLQYCLPI